MAVGNDELKNNVACFFSLKSVNIFILFVAQTIKERSQTEHKPRKQPEFSVSVFYTDKGRNVGTCYEDMMGEAFFL